MKILHIAPPWESVPPPAYGGTEAVVHLLVEELVRMGTDVALCASGESLTSAHLIAGCPHSLRTAGVEDAAPYVWAHAAAALRDAGQYDLIHNHAGEELMALAPLVPDVPMLTTMHCNLTPDRRVIWDNYDGFYNTISWSQKLLLPELDRPRFAGVAYNAIDVASYPFQTENEGYLLLLSRMSVEKGGHIAIEAARRAGRRLVIAGKVDPGRMEYFAQMIAPHIDGDRVIFAGEADYASKRDLLRSAYAVLMPIVWDEPFGLVMAEAQACGTPVVAFNRGAAPEIVRDGETGFVVETIDEMVDAIGRVHEIDPARCRRWVEEKFDGPVMARRYAELYERILGSPAGRTQKLHQLAIEESQQPLPARQDRVA